ncbi:MAG: hypothetical protein ACD_22C00230G0002 [uncultured bacterium]|nr:MAG: hypothetical protein ACD_22C00230G0002 [uncultured bacterium]
MTGFNTNWIFSMDIELDRLASNLMLVENGFYQINSFRLDPYSDKKFTSYSSHKNIQKYDINVVIPDYDYKSIPFFWETRKDFKYVEKPTIPYQLKLTKFQRQQIETIYNATVKSKECWDISKVKKAWDKINPKIYKALSKALPFSIPTNLVIYPSRLGTIASFLPATNTIVMTLREDASEQTIVNIIIRSLLRKRSQEELLTSWSESSAIEDWFLTCSTFAKEMSQITGKRYHPLLKNLRKKVKSKGIVESDKFVKNIGVSTKPFGFEVKNDAVLVDSRKVDLKNPRYMQILKAMIAKPDKTLTVDEIGTMFNSDNSEFSDYAVSKTMERLRTRLENEGISGSYIQTVRGQGYRLAGQ